MNSWQRRSQKKLFTAPCAPLDLSGESVRFGFGYAELPRICGIPVSYTHLDVYKRQELDIPLKNFQMFLSENRQQIQYSKLIAYGKQLANIKMREIQRRLNELEEMSAEIERAEECRGLRLSLIHI